MALDFPSSPVDQQIYGNFYYDASIGSWRNVGTKNGLSTRVTSLETADAGLNKSGLVPIIPTSTAVTGGTASTSTTGVVSFTTATSISLNGVFSSLYQNYKIVATGVGSTSQVIQLNLRAGGVNTTGTGYYQEGTKVQSSTGVTRYATSAIGYVYFCEASTPDWGATGEIFNPYLASRRTEGTISAWAFSTNDAKFDIGWTQVAGTQFDGLTLTFTSGTNTGTVQIYGYRS